MADHRPTDAGIRRTGRALPGVRRAARGRSALLPQLRKAAGRAPRRLPPVVGDDGATHRPRAAERPPPRPEEAAKAERDYAPLAAVGGIAVLGLMLLVGVLIGKGNNSTASAPAPIVDAGGEVAVTASTELGRVRRRPRRSRSEKTQARRRTPGAKEVAGRPDRRLPRATARRPFRPATDDLEALEGQTGESYEETVQKLPDKIATPGKPPPDRHNEGAPAAAAERETIE